MTEKKSSQYPFKFVPYEPTVDLREEDGFRRGPPGAEDREGEGDEVVDGVDVPLLHHFEIVD
jgi:hypothetical protein